MTLHEIISLFLAAFAAGIINAVAGGGTLLTFPVLLFFGTPPIIANATSTLALVVGTAGSIVGFRDHMAEVRPWLKRFVPVSLLGGGIGSVLLLHTSNATFAKIVPFLLLFATLLFLAQGVFKSLARRKITEVHSSSSRLGVVLAAAAGQFCVAIYGGYFGAGIGILMLASLGFLGLTHIHQMNALKNIIGCLINVVASLIFVAGHLIDWQRAALMSVGALGGYFIGATFSQKIPHATVRLLITLVGLAMSAVLFYERFGK